ncbi:hypothetical protein MCOR25_008155 [Pyricularia grisea]|uniref:Uncharacterized protein n=1 Tax=Pyricularia grisea TaxID=148305 RepID=A0A6P8BL32_PYRGI|nr:uncharacterized protein PgNI_02099 [Pyricularia grisea]KAI6355605.1 hypothetical protein MCOR25_008155 [Pyricularia grisea]TLD17508.1 hypothetical protein PgNI_02099 [Pyricularia grisea]
MRNSGILSLLVSFLLLISFVVAQEPSTTAAETTAQPPSTQAPPPTQSTTTDVSATGTQTSAQPSGTGSNGGGGGGSTSPSPGKGSNSGPPDVHLKVPNLSVGRIELDVDNLQADVNLAAEIAGLVSINAGVQIGITKVNITIADVQAELELVIRLGHLVDIVNRTLHTLDLNPLLINVLNEVGDIVEGVVGAVDGLLGSILQGDTKLNFIIDNLGHIVQEVVGAGGDVVSSIVGSYQQNMTFTGQQKTLDNGLIQKTYEYDALGALVNVVTNSLNQVVSAVVIKGGATNPGTGGSTTTTSATTQQPSATGMARLF